MKFYYSLAMVLLVSFATTAQKNELKAAQKLVDASSYAAALASLEAVKPVIENAEAKYAAQYYYLLGVSNQGTKAFGEAIAAYDKAKAIEVEAKLKKYSTLIEANSTSLTNDIINQAVSFNEKEQFSEASKLLYLAYMLDKANNTDYLYFAASSAVNGAAYDVALDYYIRLKELNYTGQTKMYYATEVASGNEVKVDKATQELYKKSKDFTNFREELSPSRLPEIIKNIALIYVNNGDNEAAMTAVKEARKLSPKDVGLILTEADLYIKLGDEARFGNLMQEAIAQDPNNAVLYYNLGVVNGNQGKEKPLSTTIKKLLNLTLAMNLLILI